MKCFVCRLPTIQGTDIGNQFNHCKYWGGKKRKHFLRKNSFPTVELRFFLKKGVC